jgi:RecA/RadA recombinase
MSLLDKMLKAGSVKQAAALNDSAFFKDKDPIQTELPIVNIAFSGSLKGGLIPGLTVVAGESKSFKTLLGLYCMKAYLKKYPKGIALLYDSEYGITPEYLESFDIDTSRVLHIPIEDVEQLKFDIVGRLDEVAKGDNVMVMIDSIGNLASKKEVEDALNEKSVADMSRAKALKSLFRIITPRLTTKDIPCIAVNHTYKEIGLFPKNIISGGTGIYYSANNIWILGRRQNKTGTEITGYDFVINVEKSRFVKEKSKIPISVSWEGGVETYSGLLDVAMAGGYVVKPSNGWYSSVNMDTGEISEKKVRQSGTLEKAFWDPIFANTNFKEFVKNQFTIGYKSEIDMDEILEMEV